MRHGMRYLLLSLLALLVAAAVAPGAASAGAGPFWHHRNNSKEGEGLKIEEKSPEEFSGEGGEQKLKSSIAGQPIEIVTKSQQVKGILYNNSLQGQVKFLMAFHEPRLVKPAIECKVKIGENNNAKAFVHLSWKWNGQVKQLEESPQRKVQKPDGIVSASEIAPGAKELPGGTFTTVTLSGCGVLSGSFPVQGSASAVRIVPSDLEEWGTVFSLEYGPGKLKQHFWNGTSFVGVETGLRFAGNEADLSGEGKLKSTKQEIAAFEK